MGTPDFAVASLKALLDAGKNVVAVVTSPDKPAGRGQKLHQSAVKQFASEHGLPVLQPEKLRAPDFLENLRSYKADLQVVVAFRMLPEIVWNMPPLGTINVHASLLPQYRGAAPINHAIINGEKESGVTTFLLQQEIDTGNILLSEKVEIDEVDTAGILHDKLMLAGANTLIKTIEALEKDEIIPLSQNEMSAEDLKHAPKIFKEDCLINWDSPTEEVYNKIRGLSPYPAAYTLLDGKVLKIYEATKEPATPLTKIPGTIDTDGKSFLKFKTKDGHINLISLQIEGKKRMSVEEFLRGYRFE